MEVTVITCAPNVPDGRVYDGYRNRFWPQRSIVDGVEVIRVWSWIRPGAGRRQLMLNYVSYLFTALFAFLFLVRKPSVIVATTPQFFCGITGVVASWMKRRPLVLEVRDIWPESIVTVGALQRGILIRTLERLERWMYRRADHIVAVGPGYRDNILSKVDVADRISIVTNGVDLRQFQLDKDASAFKQQYDLEGRFVCSYIGTVGRAHGLEIVVQAARRLREESRDDIVFLIVGGGNRLEVIQSMVADEGLDHWVKITGRVPKSDIPIALTASHACLVHLSKTDLFEHVIPSKIFETMAMQRPIIMGVRGPAREIVIASESGVALEPENYDELFQIVATFSQHRESARTMGLKGREFVAEHFNRDVLAADMLKIVRRTATGEHFTMPDRMRYGVDRENSEQGIPAADPAPTETPR